MRARATANKMQAPSPESYWPPLSPDFDALSDHAKYMRMFSTLSSILADRSAMLISDTLRATDASAHTTSCFARMPYTLRTDGRRPFPPSSPPNPQMPPPTTRVIWNASWVT